MSQATLIQQGLLQFTLNAPEHAKPFSFSLGTDIQVSLLATGVMLFEPLKEASRAVVLSAGIHGNETGPIELLDQWVTKILKQQVRLCQPLLIILGNPPAMIKGSRELRLNLNRLFIGQHKKYAACYEVARAQELEQILLLFYQRYLGLPAFHLDLHTAIRASQHEKFAIYPFTHGQPWKRTSLALLQACGVDCVLFSNEPAPTFSYHSSFNHNAVAFTVELGKVQPFGENNLAKFSELNRVFDTLLAEKDLHEFAFKAEQAKLYQVSDVINKTDPDFSFSFSQQQANFSEYPSNYRLAQDGCNEIYVKDGPKAIVFPNEKVALGQRAVLLVKKMTAKEIELAVSSQQLV
ncbi:succinylglutamate desuccinylase [Agarivorans sp. TSD2052]|uniref:succinylglutamate desuccinylase n=1 Tax=Agarivorans sp. TSD2052 TaxID=2937286 RepID=UPI00200DC5AA|nr:succinylglutamate desuccinylase [Agarivorans sp. TSD2052]UPW20477.1 succinylglutamate desuccinylase [Agarivorans sp. TSD2052]